jgi:phosphoribosylformylglycinamidine cyclo-ligase
LLSIRRFTQGFPEAGSSIVPGSRQETSLSVFSSSGKATYEDNANSGIGSNGFTVAKHVLLSSYYRDKYPETFAETIQDAHVYTGSLKLEDRLPGARCSVGKALLSPTRTYAPVVKEICHTVFSAVRGIIHCTGGGLTKSMKFGTGLKCIKDSLFPLPPIFSAIQGSGMIADRDMWRIFNCGHRLEVYCDADAAQKIIDIGSRFGIDAKVIGRIEAPAVRRTG